jgi:hypothetical protein
VKGSTKLAVASSLMGLGMTPMLLWLAMLVAAIDHLRTGEFGLPELMFAGVAGMSAYLATLVVAGATARRHGRRAPRREIAHRDHGGDPPHAVGGRARAGGRTDARLKALPCA